MDKTEALVRLFEAAAKAYGGPSSIHVNPAGIVKMATDWYNEVLKLEVPDTAAVTGTLSLPRKSPPK